MSKEKLSTEKISNLDYGFVSKDSSKLEVINADLDEYNYCVAAYRKKQEYGGAEISIPKLSCPPEKRLIQFNSYLKENDT